jgi:hypothetical protein
MPVSLSAEILDSQGFSFSGTVRKSGFPESRTVGVWLSGTVGEEELKA